MGDYNQWNKHKDRGGQHLVSSTTTSVGTTNNICNNCGKIGHLFQLCKLPINSFGIIVFTICPGSGEPMFCESNGLHEISESASAYSNSNNNSSNKAQIKYLMIRRKDSFGYIDFIRGKYSPYNMHQLQTIIDQMSIEEKQRLLNSLTYLLQAKDNSGNGRTPKSDISCQSEMPQSTTRGWSSVERSLINQLFNSLWQNMWNGNSFTKLPIPIPIPTVTCVVPPLPHSTTLSPPITNNYETNWRPITSVACVLEPEGIQEPGNQGSPNQGNMMPAENNRWTNIKSGSDDIMKVRHHKSNKDYSIGDRTTYFRGLPPLGGRTKDKIENHSVEYDNALKKYEILCASYDHRDRDGGNTSVDSKLKTLIQNSKTHWTETEWEFPKGRRENPKEKELDAALREFEEETGISKSYLNIIENVVPYEETFIGTNQKAYKHKYFLAYINPNNLNYKLFQKNEVSKIECKTFDECMRTIRPYNIEKKNILTNINSILLDNGFFIE